MTACVRCGGTESVVKNSMLTCASCTRSWHHRCHLPNITDQELVSRLEAYTKGDKENGLLGWKCRQCKKKGLKESTNNPKIEVGPPPSQPGSPSRSVTKSEAREVVPLELNTASPPIVVPDPSIDVPMVLDSPTPALPPVPAEATVDAQVSPKSHTAPPPVPHYDLLPHWLSCSSETDDIWGRALQRRQSGNTKRHERKATAKKLGTFRPISSNNLVILNTNTDGWGRRTPN